MALDCDAAAASEVTYPIEFINAKGTRLPIGSESSGVCYTQTTVPGGTSTVLKPAINTGIGLIDKLFSWIKVPTVVQNPDKVVTNNMPWSLHSLNIEAKGDIKIWWRDDGHLMATIPAIHSTLTGTDGDTGYVLPYMMPLYTGPIGYALNAVVSPGIPPGVPPDNDPNWRFCLGGWWSAGVVGCGTACPDAYRNPAGGTPYWWNKWDGEDAKFVTNGNVPSRWDRDITWDLGEIEPQEGLGLYLYARVVRGYCGSQRFEPRDGARQALGFNVPLPALCPPEITDVAMERDICEEKVWADITLDIPGLGGNASVDLYLEYAPNDSFYGAQVVTKPVSAKTTVTVRVPNLIPNVRYCFRAKLGTRRVESEWTDTFCETALFMPRADWVVPLLTLEECEAMTEGDCIPEFTENTPGLEECKGEA